MLVVVAGLVQILRVLRKTFRHEIRQVLLPHETVQTAERPAAGTRRRVQLLASLKFGQCTT